jgi:hypothetical protein
MLMLAMWTVPVSRFSSRDFVFGQLLRDSSFRVASKDEIMTVLAH